MKKNFLSILFFLSFCLNVGNVAAIHVAKDNNIFINSPLNEDSYLLGKNIKIESAIHGDLKAIAKEIFIQHKIYEDAFLIGENIYINASIGDDLHVMGSKIYIGNIIYDNALILGNNIKIAADIKGSAFMMGKTIHLEKNIEGDLNLKAQTVILDGTVKGNVKIKAQNIIINGTIKGNSELTAEKIEIGLKAEFHNNVLYYHKYGDINFGSKIISGSALFSPDLKKDSHEFKKKWDSLLLPLIFNACLLGLLVFFIPGFFEKSAQFLHKSVWKSFFLGLAFFIVFPTLIIMLFISVIGIPIALIGLFAYFVTMYFAPSYTAIIFACLIKIFYKKKWKKNILYLVSLAVFMVMLILKKFFGPLSLLGNITNIVAIFSATGAAILCKKELMKKTLKIINK